VVPAIETSAMAANMVSFGGVREKDMLQNAVQIGGCYNKGVQPLGGTSVSDFGGPPLAGVFGGILGGILHGHPSSLPALQSGFKSFQIVTRAVDNLRDPAGNLKSTSR
jgi:hypothetical protein